MCTAFDEATSADVAFFVAVGNKSLGLCLFCSNSWATFISIYESRGFLWVSLLVLARGLKNECSQEPKATYCARVNGL